MAARHGLAAVPYFALASGFLTGKYRPGTTVDSARSGGALKYVDTDRGQRVLQALDTVAAAHEAELLPPSPSPGSPPSPPSRHPSPAPARWNNCRHCSRWPT